MKQTGNYPLRTTSVSTYVLDTDYTIVASAPCTIYMTPDPATGDTYEIKRDGYGEVVVDGYGSTIDGYDTFSLYAHGQSALIRYNGTQWNVSASNAFGSDTRTTNSQVKTIKTETSTTTATPTTVGSTFTLVEDAITTVDVEAHCIKAGAPIARVFNVRRHFLNNGGVIEPTTQVDLAGPYDIVNVGSAMSATDVNIEYSGTTGRVDITGLASTNLRWLVETRITSLTAEASGGVEYDPAVLALTGWWKAGNYNSGTGTWTGTASAGTSGANDLTEATNKPTDGAALNGLNTVEFTRASSQKLTADGTLGDYFTTSYYSGWALVYSDGFTNNNANPNLSDGILSDNGGAFAISGNTGTPNVVFQHDDGVQNRCDITTMSNSAWHLIQYRFDSATGFAEIRLDNGAWDTVAASTLVSAAGTFQVGCEYAASKFFDGRMADIGTIKARLSDLEFDNIRVYCNGTYGVSV
jgi:hypothetical protein